MSYLAFVLDDQSRTLLLEKINPVHPDVIAHHITIQFSNPSSYPSSIKHYTNATLEVIGHASNDLVQVAIVAVNSDIIRDDGQVFHITISVDRSKGGKPAMSRDLIETQIWKPIKRFTINGTIEVCD